MKNALPEPWKNWAEENLELGVPSQKIFETLINNNFDQESIEAVIKGGKPPTNSITTKQSKPELRVSSYIVGAEKVDVKDNVLDIYTIDNFISKADCKKLADLVKSDMKQSTVSYANKASGYIDNSVRTSSTCNLVRSTSDIVSKVDDKILECIGIHQSRGEAIQGQHYDKNQEFKQHTDTFAPNSEEYKLHCEGKGGQRTWTFMLYLNSTRKGGETKFNRVKDKLGNELVFKPKVGTAVLWNNLNQDGSPNTHSMHQGCPVESGEKLIITKWFREGKV